MATKPIDLSQSEKSPLPKIDIKGVLNSIAGEDLNTLIPLYYTFLQRDLHLGAESHKRRMQIISTPYVLNGDEKTVEFVQDYLNQIDINSLILDISLAINYGFSITDMVYDTMTINGKGYFLPKEFHSIHPRFTETDIEDDNKILIRKNALTKIDPAKKKEKFLVHLHKTDSGGIIDYGIMHKLIFTVLIKHVAMNANLKYFEDLGIPPVIINVNEDDEKEVKRILNQVLNLRSQSAGIFPKEANIELLEGKTGKTEFLNFVSKCDLYISNYILGNTLSGSGGEGGGSYALGQVHDTRRKDILRFDAKLIAESLNKLIGRVLTLCGKDPKSCTLKFDTTDKADEDLLSKTYERIEKMGYEIPIEHIEKTFNIPGLKRKKEPAKEANVKEPNAKEPNAKEPNAKTPGAVDDIDKVVNERYSDDYKQIEKEIEETLSDLLDGCESYDDAFEKLEEIYSQTNLETLERGMFKAIANANLKGGYDESNK